MNKINKNLLSKTRPNFARYEGNSLGNSLKRSMYVEFERTEQNLWTYRWGAVGFPQSGENNQLAGDEIPTLINAVIVQGYRLVDESEIPVTELSNPIVNDFWKWLDSRN